MSNHQGVFCISIDAQPTNAGAAHLAERQQDVLQLMRQFGMSANWTTQTAPRRALSPDRELTLVIPPQIQRAELVLMLRRMNAALSRDQSRVRSVVVDPHEARQYWDVLVRQGCHVLRPRTMAGTRETATQVLRGGLWMTPISCSFVGGSRRSVRNLFSVCQRHLVATANARRVYHLNVDLSNERSSWKEELEALRALLQTASDLRSKDRLRCVKLSELPTCLTRKVSKPMTSVLRRAA